MQLKPADSPAPVEDDTETNTTESVASTGATRTVIEMKPPSRSSGKRDQVAEPDTVAQKPKKREKKSASLPNVGRTARTQPDGSAYEPSVPKEVTDKERDSVSLRGLRSQCADNALLTELANKRAHGDNFFQMANPFAKDDDLDVSDTIFDVANEFPDLILVGGMPTTPRAEKPKKRAAPSKVPKKSTGQMIVQKTQDEADVCCGCDCEEHDPSLLETACEEKAQITAAVNKPAPNIDNFFEMADPFANDDDMLDISDTIFDVANEFPDVLFQEGDIGTRRREGLNDKNEIEPRTAMLDVRPNQQSAKA
ncbi:hypothetical protein Q1695_008211 [Nippostrongylus brasiliensis]|nr:hypothetical protein Q1695_008211 [Nippostrongylus brasiliensis]